MWRNQKSDSLIGSKSRVSVKLKKHNVLGKRAGQASEPVKISHIQHLTTHYITYLASEPVRQASRSRFCIFNIQQLITQAILKI
jgi:hypothetical protein